MQSQERSVLVDYVKPAEKLAAVCLGTCKKLVVFFVLHLSWDFPPSDCNNLHQVTQCTSTTFQMNTSELRMYWVLQMFVWFDLYFCDWGSSEHWKTDINLGDTVVLKITQYATKSYFHIFLIASKCRWKNRTNTAMVHLTGLHRLILFIKTSRFIRLINEPVTQFRFIFWTGGARWNNEFWFSRCLFGFCRC